MKGHTAQCFGRTGSSTPFCAHGECPGLSLSGSSFFFCQMGITMLISREVQRQIRHCVCRAQAQSPPNPAPADAGLWLLVIGADVFPTSRWTQSLRASGSWLVPGHYYPQKHHNSEGDMCPLHTNPTAHENLWLLLPSKLDLINLGCWLMCEHICKHVHMLTGLTCSGLLVCTHMLWLSCSLRIPCWGEASLESGAIFHKSNSALKGRLVDLCLPSICVIPEHVGERWV
jgi:hypothetical protein